MKIYAWYKEDNIVNKDDIIRWVIFAAVFITIWIVLDFVFSILRAAVFVFARAFKTALYSAVIATIIFAVMDIKRR